MDSNETSQKINAGREETALFRIGFRRPLLASELTGYLIPHLQENPGKDIRFVLDQGRDENPVISGHLTNRRSRLPFRFNPAYNGFRRRVYNEIEFYPEESQETLSDSIIEGIRRVRTNISDYFAKADTVSSL